MFKKILTAIIVGAFCLGFLAACGNDEPSGPTEQEIALAECHDTLDPLSEVLNELDSKLAIEIGYRDYVSDLQDAQTIYDEIDIDAMSQDCLDVGVNYEKALRKYAKAQILWSECLSLYCSAGQLQNILSSLWNQAYESLEQADDEWDSYS